MTDIAGERARLAAQGLTITYRETWGAVQNYTSARDVNRPAQWLFLHITVTDDPEDIPADEYEACRVVERIGQDRFGIGWSYNAGVMQSGRLYEGQPLTRRGAHTVNDKPNPNFPEGSLNYDARACALVQNVQDVVTDAQIDSAARWGAALRRSGEAIATARWYGHRDVTAKSCPGDKGYARLGELNALTDHYAQHGLTPEDDMPPFPLIRPLIRGTGADGTPAGAIYYTDGMLQHFRWVPNEQTLKDIQYKLRVAKLSDQWEDVANLSAVGTLVGPAPAGYPKAMLPTVSGVAAADEALTPPSP